MPASSVVVVIYILFDIPPTKTWKTNPPSLNMSEQIQLLLDVLTLSLSVNVHVSVPVHGPIKNSDLQPAATGRHVSELSDDSSLQPSNLPRLISSKTEMSSSHQGLPKSQIHEQNNYCHCCCFRPQSLGVVCYIATEIATERWYIIETTCGLVTKI